MSLLFMLSYKCKMNSVKGLDVYNVWLMVTAGQTLPGN